MAKKNIYQLGNYQSYQLYVNEEANGELSVFITDTVGIKQYPKQLVFPDILLEEFGKNLTSQDKQPQLIGATEVAQFIKKYCAQQSIQKNPFCFAVEKKPGGDLAIVFSKKHGLQGGSFGLNNVFGIVVGTGQIGAGIALTVFTGGFGTAVGGVLISSGISGTYKSLATSSEQLTVCGYAKDTAIGAISGVVTGGVGFAGGAVISKMALEGGKKVAGGVVVSAFNGLLGTTTRKVASNVAEGAEVFHDYGPSEAAIATLGGVLSFGFKVPTTAGLHKVGQKTAEKIMGDTQKVVSSKAAQVLIESGSGGLGGAIGSVGTKVVKNCAQGKNISKDLARSAFSGFVSGASKGIGKGIEHYHDNNQHQNQQDHASEHTHTQEHVEQQEVEAGSMRQEPAPRTQDGEHTHAQEHTDQHEVEAGSMRQEPAPRTQDGEHALAQEHTDQHEVEAGSMRQELVPRTQDGEHALAQEHTDQHEVEAGRMRQECVLQAQDGEHKHTQKHADREAKSEKTNTLSQAELLSRFHITTTRKRKISAKEATRVNRREECSLNRLNRDLSM